MTRPDRSASGQPVLRHGPKPRPFRPAADDRPALRAIERHVSQHLGEVSFVVHELASNLVHVDLHVIPASDDRPFITIVTSGMSDLPMAVPEHAEDLRFAELMICLPDDWPLDPQSLKNQRHFWPLRVLRYLARMPHEDDTWLAWGHTVANGDPPRPFAPNTQLCGSLLLAPTLVGPEFEELRVRGDKTVNFYAVFPLLQEEMDFKLEHGIEALIPYLNGAKLTEVLDLTRRSVLDPGRGGAR